MSARYPMRIPTDINGTSSSGNRGSPVYSPLHTQPSPSYSNAHNVMNSRKRPLDPRTRGQSPADKRSRLPERSGSLQDRYADPGSPTFPSPPVSRKNSLVGLPPNVPTGPAPKTRSGLRIDSYRPGHDQETTDRSFSNDHFRGAGSPFARTDDQVMSPRSNGSEASTPVHNAPPAPNMVPVPDTSSNSSVLQGQGPLTMASLRTLQLRKQAIANANKSNSISARSLPASPSETKLQEQLAACQAEISHLKKDREDMMARITSLEGLSTRLGGVADETDPLKQQSDTTSLRVRVEALDKLDIPSHFSRLNELVTLPKKINEVTSSMAQFDKTVKDMQAQVTRTNSRTEQSFSELQTNIASFKAWREAQSAAPAITKGELQTEVLSAVETAIKVTQTDNKTWRANVAERLNQVDKSMLSVLEGEKSLVKFKGSQERINQTTAEEVKEIRAHDTRTYAKAQRVEDQIDGLERSVNERFKNVWKEFDDDIGPARAEAKDTGKNLVERIQTLESSQAKLKKDCNQLKSNQEDFRSSLDELNTSHGKLNITLEKLNSSSKQPSDQLGLPKTDVLRSPSPHFKKVGVPVQPTNNESPKAIAVTESLNKIDIELTQFKETLEELQSRLKSAELVSSRHDDLATQINDLGQKVSRLDIAVNETNKPLKNVTANGSGSSIPVDTQILQIQTELKEVVGNIDQLDNGLQLVEQTIHTHANLIAGLGEEVPKLFRDKFDPFKRSAEEQIAGIEGVLDQLGSSIAALKVEVGNSNAQLARQSAQQSAQLSTQNSTMKAQQTQVASVLNAAKSLKEQVDKLEASLSQEVSARERSIQAIMQQIATKVGSGDVNPQLDALKVALQSLEHRYENITTDQLHQGMVHWFNQNYPNQGNLIAQVGDLRQEVNRLLPLVQTIMWIQQSAPQLKTLAQYVTELQQIPHIRVQADKASSDAQLAIARTGESQKHVETIQTTLRTLQTAVDSLSKDPKSPVKAEAVYVLEKAVVDLRNSIVEIKQSSEDLVKHVNQGFSREQQARIDLSSEIKTTATLEHDNRVQVEFRMKDNNNALTKRVTAVENSFRDLRRDFDTVNEDDIQPNKNFFCLQPMVAVSVAQLQHTVEDVNQNTGSRNPIPITWVHDFNKMQDPSGKGKGKKDK